MDKWAKDWLEEQREQGTKCLETRVSHLKIKFDIQRPSAFAVLPDFWS